MCSPIVFGRPQRALALAPCGDRLDVQGRAEVLPSVLEASGRDAAPPAERRAANFLNELSSSPKDQVGERGEAGEVPEFDDEVEPGAILEGAVEDTKEAEAGQVEAGDVKDIGEDERKGKIRGDKMCDEVEDGAIDGDEDNGIEGNAEAEGRQRGGDGEDMSKAEKEEDDEGEVVMVNPKAEEEGKRTSAGAAGGTAADQGDGGDGNGQIARAGNENGNGAKVPNGKGSEAPVPVKSVLALPPPLEKKGLTDVEFYKKEMGILRMANGLIAEVRPQRERQTDTQTER